jgi:hypothetical protein
MASKNGPICSGGIRPCYAHPIEDRHHVGVGGHRVEREREPVLVIDEHAVGHDEVEVHVEVD